MALLQSVSIYHSILNGLGLKRKRSHAQQLQDVKELTAHGERSEGQ